MGRLKECIHAGSTTLDKIAGKDVCLIVGKTGTGKSSLIQGVAGKKFKGVQHSVESKRETLNKIVFEAENPLEGFEIGHEKTSKTEAINCFERKTGNKDLETIFYVDSPGFEDTNGFEVDIATSVMISQVAKLCRSMRFIIMINFASLHETRGDAMRAVLKIIRTFVRDFEVKKKSFAFLFSHTSEFLPQGGSAASRHLYREIVHIYQTTQDDDVKTVLRFIKKSLERKYPYVQIFHPMSFDFGRFVKFAESKLEPIKSSELTVIGALTLAAQSTLRGEVKSNLLELNRILSKCPTDTARVQDIMETLEYLGDSVSLVDIKQTASDCKESIEIFCTKETLLVEEKIRQGTSLDTDFTTTDAARLRHAMNHLLELKQSSPTYFFNLMKQRLCPFKKGVLNRDCVSFREVPRHLGSLQAWAREFPEFCEFYDEVLCHYNGLLAGYEMMLTTLLSKDLYKATEEDFVPLLQHLNVLESLVDHQRLLSKTELQIDPAIASFKKTKSRIHQTVTKWKTEFDGKMHADEFSIEELLEIATLSRVLIVLQSTFEKRASSLDPEGMVGTLLEEIKSRIVGYYQEMAQKWSSSSSVPLSRESFDRIKVLETGASMFADLPGSKWRETQFAFRNVVAIVRSELSQKAENISRKSEHSIENGIFDGQMAGRALVSLNDCLCFDEIFDSRDRFLANVSTKVRGDYIRRMKRIKKVEDQSLKALFAPHEDSSKALEDLKDCFGEIHQISVFCSVVEFNEFARMEEELRSNLDEFLDKMIRRSDNCIKNWVDASEKYNLGKLKKETGKLDSLLREMNLISEFFFSDKARTIVTRISSAFTTFKDQVQCAFDSEDFPLLASHLSCIEVINEYSLASKDLPNFEKCQRQAHEIIDARVQAIEELVSETANFDEMDELIVGLEKAKCIDRYIGGQVGSRLSPILKIREKKEDDVDQTLQEMIDNENFHGIHDFLAPMANSKDQMKRRKFNDYRQQIVSCLEEEIKAVSSLLNYSLKGENTGRIVKSLCILKKAEAEMGSLLRTKICLSTEIQRSKRLVCNKLEAFLATFVDAYKELNLKKMAISNLNAKKFVASFHDEISSSTLNKADRESRRYEETIKSIPSQINRFLNDGFSNSSNVLKLLSGLRKGSESTHPATEGLTDLYRQCSGEIREGIELMLANWVREVTEMCCFEDGVALLHSMILELEGPLKNHIETSDIVFECSNKLDLWQKKAASGLEMVDFDDPDIKTKLNALSEKLDKLQSPSWYQRFKSFTSMSSESSYDIHRDQLIRQVNERDYQASTALTAGNYVGVQSGIEVLELINFHLAPHIPDAGTILLDLKTRIEEKSIYILEAALKILNAGSDLTSFESFFADIRSLALAIPFVSSNKDVAMKFNLVNQLVYENLRARVTAALVSLRMESDLDFAAVRESVENARSFGSFVADHYTLFHEEVKNSKHITGDKWFGEIDSLCHEYFHAGREFNKIKYFAALGIVPSSEKEAIRRAFKQKARLYHPDKSLGDTNAKFRIIKEAEAELLATVGSRASNRDRPFDPSVYRVGESLRTQVKAYLQEDRYDMISKVLYGLSGLVELKSLVVPELECDRIQDGVEELVRDHVHKAKIEVKTQWSERKYRNLNDTIVDLQAMESHLKSHPRVFDESWNEGIIEEIESEISRLGNAASALLSSETSAKENESAFRRHFMQMGHVLFEIESLKDVTKQIMAEILELLCAEGGWGYGYVFELGLSLHRSGDEDDEAAHVAHLILAEFSHFKEVLTMAWNNETTQKPAEDSVTMIKAHTLASYDSTLDLDQDALLRSFEVFEAQYNTFLGEYIRPGADKAALVSNIVGTCKQITPVECLEGWNQDVRSTIPKILGGVFALFTICKSGETFNRVESSDAASKLGQQILLKPHNIQVLTLLYMFGCSSQNNDTLESQLLQIRTGEGKSMILGAAATVLGLLGFKVRCVCYSEYLSSRDYGFFEEVFSLFGLDQSRIKYSKITGFSEESTASKGDIRSLTGALLRGNLAAKCSPKRTAGARMPQSFSCNKISSHQANTSVNQSVPSFEARERNLLQENNEKSQHEESTLSYLRSAETEVGMNEILLVDEVDVFFGADFYGQTYNQVSQLREPEIQHILKAIWISHKQGGRRLRLSDIEKMDEFKWLVSKFPTFRFALENEVSRMLDDVRRVDEEPYYLDSNDRIGYKVMDTISYDVTLGYRTAFAYLKEYDAGNLRDETQTLAKMLTLNISCAQFSYAGIRPKRILGVSGTLDAMGHYEKSVLQKYGISKFIFMPSCYGQSNFAFDKAGDGIFIESGVSDYYHKICSEVSTATALNRAVIIFFADAEKLEAFEASSFYRQLGRKKMKLPEAMGAVKKDFIIKKAATAGQVTICSRVFGRGTDFFCKDKKIEENGGVKVIQTFLSAEKSEEIQVQGRTARQGKRGTYQLILLDSDLEAEFNVPRTFKDRVPKREWYDSLCEARGKKYDQLCEEMEENLVDATSRDRKSHCYFEALLAADSEQASSLFKEIYQSIKKKAMPSCIEIDLGYVVDVTGSMSPYAKAAEKAVNNLLVGNGSILKKLKTKFPEVEFKLRVGSVAFRDIEDSTQQFHESCFADDCHFTANMPTALQFIKQVTEAPSGGYDLAEDLFGGIHKCTSWTGAHDWTAMIKIIILVTDAPAHGLVPPCSQQVVNADNFPQVHPSGLSAESVVNDLVAKGIDLFFCSFDPSATATTEETLSKLHLKHPDNAEQREIVCIPMGPKKNSRSGNTALLGSQSQHIIFVLDESGSMQHNWSGVVGAYIDFLSYRVANQSMNDLVSVVQFSSSSRVTVCQEQISLAPQQLGYDGGCTYYSPAAEEAQKLALATPYSHQPVVIFMSDGMADESDALNTAKIFKDLSIQTHARWGRDLALHVIAFGAGLDTRQLANITLSSSRGKIHTSANVAQLSDVFVEIAHTSSDIAGVLEAEIGRRISQAISDKVALEYLG